jgi:hypothetical protein
MAKCAQVKEELLTPREKGLTMHDKDAWTYQIVCEIAEVESNV